MTENEGKIKTVHTGGSKIWIFFLAFAVLLFAVGVYLGFIKSAGFVRTTGVVVSVRTVEHYDSELGRNVESYYPTVAYTVDGQTYNVYKFRKPMGDLSVYSTGIHFIDPTTPLNR